MDVNAAIVAADTVSLDAAILPKPADAEKRGKCSQALRGRQHYVISAARAAPARRLMGALGGANRIRREVLASNLGTAAGQQIPVVLIGRYVSQSALGQYRYADRITLTPLALVVSAAAYVVLPAFARISDDRKRFQGAFVQSLRWFSTLAMPLGLILIPLGVPLAVVLFGEVWRDAGEAAMALSVYTVGASLVSVASETFKAEGRPQLLIRVHAVSMGTAVVAMVALLGYDLVGVAAGLSIGLAIGAVYALATVGQMIEVPRRTIVAQLWPSALAALVMAAVLLPLDRLPARADRAGDLRRAADARGRGPCRVRNLCRVCCRWPRPAPSPRRAGSRRPRAVAVPPVPPRRIRPTSPRSPTRRRGADERPGLQRHRSRVQRGRARRLGADLGAAAVASGLGGGRGRRRLERRDRGGGERVRPRGRADLGHQHPEPGALRGPQHRRRALPRALRELPRQRRPADARLPRADGRGVGRGSGGGVRLHGRVGAAPRFGPGPEGDGDVSLEPARAAAFRPDGDDAADAEGQLRVRLDDGPAGGPRRRRGLRPRAALGGGLRPLAADTRQRAARRTPSGRARDQARAADRDVAGPHEDDRQPGGDVPAPHRGRAAVPEVRDAARARIERLESVAAGLEGRDRRRAAVIAARRLLSPLRSALQPGRRWRRPPSEVREAFPDLESL